VVVCRHGSDRVSPTSRALGSSWDRPTGSTRSATTSSLIAPTKRTPKRVVDHDDLLSMSWINGKGEVVRLLEPGGSCSNQERGKRHPVERDGVAN
jgi:hypothetical protein